MEVDGRVVPLLFFVCFLVAHTASRTILYIKIVKLLMGILSYMLLVGRSLRYACVPVVQLIYDFCVPKSVTDGQTDNPQTENISILVI